MSAESEVRALLWLDAQMPMDDAELIVRMARASRWPGVRFNTADVDRASRAIQYDRGYRKTVVVDALQTVSRAGIGYARLTVAELALEREDMQRASAGREPS